MAYHKSIGFEEIFIYSNNNDDGSDAILRILAEAGEIVWCRNVAGPHCAPQRKAYGHAFALSREVLQYRWSAVIDLDEFFVIDKTRFRNLDAFMTVHDGLGADVVHLNWTIMASCGRLAYDRAPVFRRFAARLTYGDPHTKCIARTSLCMHSTPHYPVLKAWDEATHVNADGSPFAFSVNPGLSETAMIRPACINHYFFKSRDEFLLKFSRNRGTDLVVTGAALPVPDEFVAEFRKQFASRDVAADDALEAWASDAEAYAARLSALPGMMRAIEGVEDWSRRAIRGLDRFAVGEGAAAPDGGDVRAPSQDLTPP